MLKHELIAHYRLATRVARALGVADSSVHKWGPVVPYFSAVRAEILTNRDVPLIAQLYDARGNPLKGRALSDMLRQLRRTRRSAARVKQARRAKTADTSAVNE